MKKFAIATVVFMAASLTACGGASDTAKDAASTPATSSSSGPSTSTTTSAPTTPESSDTSTPTGTDSGSSYCDELRSAKSQFENLNITGLNDDAFNKVTDEFDALASAAPSAVRDDWVTLSSALTKVQQILASANLSFDDLKNLSAQHLPPGVTIQQLEKVSRQLAKFSNDKSFSAAAKKISADAKAECGINLGN